MCSLKPAGKADGESCRGSYAKLQRLWARRKQRARIELCLAQIRSSRKAMSPGG
jgi:hypothetical protein